MYKVKRLLGLVVTLFLILATTVPALAQVNPQPAQALWVDPAFTDNLEEGDTFTIDIYINITDPDGIGSATGLYAYEFRLYWENDKLTCTGATDHLPYADWNAPNSFTAGAGITQDYNATHGRYWRGIAALPIQSPYPTPFVGVMSICTLTFEVIDQPLYAPYIGLLQLAKNYGIDTSMGDDTGSAFPFTAYDGQYEILASAPVECEVTFLTDPVGSGFSIAFMDQVYENGSAATFPYGTSGLIVANAPAGWVFDLWETTGDVEIVDSTLNITCGGTVKAVYARGPELSVDPKNILDPTLVPCENFTVYVKVFDVSDLYAWEVKLYYRNDILNATGITEGPFLNSSGPTSFVIREFSDEYNTTHGLVWVNATLQSPPSVNGNGTLVTISFHVEALGESELDLSDTKLRDQAAAPIPHGVSDGYFSNFTPLPGDANNDGVVDIEDVLFLAIHFGSSKEDDPSTPWNDTRNWDPVADLNGDDRVNIFDFVIIGINFGRER